MVILWGQQKLILVELWEACLDIVEEYMRPASKIDHDDASLTHPHAPLVFILSLIKKDKMLR